MTTTVPSRPDLDGDHIWVESWSDPLVDQHGADVRSRYVEQVWLGVLGPTTVWLLRRLVDGLDADPGGFVLELAETASALGLGGTGRNSPLVRSFGRACQFGLARQEGPATIQVRRRVPPATPGQVARLPESSRRVHDDWMRRAADRPGTVDRARAVASTLVEVGEPVSRAEQVLCQLSVAPAAAYDAIAWAKARHPSNGPARPDPG